MGDHGSSSVSRKYSGTIAPTNVRTTPVDLDTTIIGGPGIGASGELLMPPRLPRRTCDEDEIGAVLVAPFGNFDAPGGYHCKTSGELAPIARACSNVITVDPFPAAERPFAETYAMR